MAGLLTHLVECELALEVDEEPAVAGEVIIGPARRQEGNQLWIQQLHQRRQRRQLRVHAPARRHTHACSPRAGQGVPPPEKNLKLLPVTHTCTARDSSFVFFPVVSSKNYLWMPKTMAWSALGGLALQSLWWL